MPAFQLSGLWVPLITPFTDDNNVDIASLSQLCRRVLDDGATGVVVLGTTGEPATLDDSERKSVIDTCASVCAAMNRPMMVGVGGNNTAEAIRAVQTLSAINSLAAILVVVPYYTRPSASGVVQHFQAIAHASHVPIVAYNIPYRTGIALTASTIIEIANITNVGGMKQSVGGLDYDTLEVLRSRPPTFAVLAGDDAFIAPTMAMGGEGAISAAAHVCTPMFVRLVSSTKAGDWSTARQLAGSLLPVVRAGFAEPSPAVWKAVLHAQGVISSPNLRLPMCNASESSRDLLLAAITEIDR